MKLTNKRLKRLIKEALIKEAKLSRQQHKVRRHINKLRKTNKIDEPTWRKARRAVYKDPQGQTALTFLTNHSKQQAKPANVQQNKKDIKTQMGGSTQQTANKAVSSAMAAAKDAIKPQAKQQSASEKIKAAPADPKKAVAGAPPQAATPKVGEIDPAVAAKQKAKEDAMVAASGKTKPQQQKQQKKYDFSRFDTVNPAQKKRALAVFSKRSDPKSKALVQYLQKSLKTNKSTVQTQTTTTDAKLDHSADDTGIRARMATAALQNARKKYKNSIQHRKARRAAGLLYDKMVAAGWNPKTGVNGIKDKGHRQEWKKLIGN
jgi:hypothetical protein